MLDGTRMQDEGGAGRDVLICFSHLRWDFVFQRPQHLLTRAARTMRVIYWEEPAWDVEQGLKQRVAEGGVLVVQPCLAHGTDWADAPAVQRTLLDGLLRQMAVADPVLW